MKTLCIWLLIASTAYGATGTGTATLHWIQAGPGNPHEVSYNLPTRFDVSYEILTGLLSVRDFTVFDMSGQEEVWSIEPFAVQLQDWFPNIKRAQVMTVDIFGNEIGRTQLTATKVDEMATSIRMDFLYVDDRIDWGPPLGQAALTYTPVLGSTIVVPEPGTWVLCMLGFFFLHQCPLACGNNGKLG